MREPIRHINTRIKNYIDDVECSNNIKDFLNEMLQKEYEHINEKRPHLKDEYYSTLRKYLLKEY